MKLILLGKVLLHLLLVWRIFPSMGKIQCTKMQNLNGHTVNFYSDMHEIVSLSYEAMQISSPPAQHAPTTKRMDRL